MFQSEDRQQQIISNQNNFRSNILQPSGRFEAFHFISTFFYFISIFIRNPTMSFI